MNHIANCMRPDGERSPVYISQETSFFRMSVSAKPPTHAMSVHLPRRSRSLREIQSFRETKEPRQPQSQSASLAKSPSLANLNQPTTSRYQLWPSSNSSSSSRSPVGLTKNNTSYDKITALAVGRSSTSLSDSAALPESVPFWQRTSALARRRKVSVPELGNTMTTVQEMAIDSRECFAQYHYTHANSTKPPFPVGLLSVNTHTRTLVTRGRAAFLAPTGKLVHLAMPWFLASQDPLQTSPSK
jgi:hypothetical protein